MALNPQDVDEMHETTKKLLELWMRTKLVFLKAFSGEPITQEHENAYLQLKSEISRLYRVISDKLTPGLMFDGDKMLEMLKNAVTMEHLQRQSPAERSNLISAWHRIYIRMTRTLGALEVMQSGYYPHLHRALLTGKGAGKGKGRWGRSAKKAA
ncbi:MAG TPA: hypothetical protein PLS90_01760 [Candidatus Sumerlaeota bacterium]|nr:MAG: hypothetical protein BWZ08_02019 [candidate division BRC1 bacterium ADurb.BinA292]HOE96646.1 hypothetical protein [Candidatus Sumerlaeota bacterium]HOR28236.1 hypothetical protein [Candidatus Sumerlaeota bacterium]HPK01160.1 hypothetical protein [Candidatus Sumerlaeota bacterium]